MSSSSRSSRVAADTRGSIGLEYAGIYFVATVIGVVMLTGWGLASYDHARFSHDTLTMPYGAPNLGHGGGSGGGSTTPAPTPELWPETPTFPPPSTEPPPAAEDTTGRGHIIAPQERKQAGDDPAVTAPKR